MAASHGHFRVATEGCLYRWTMMNRMDSFPPVLTREGMYY